MEVHLNGNYHSPSTKLVDHAQLEWEWEESLSISHWGYIYSSLHSNRSHNCIAKSDHVH